MVYGHDPDDHKNSQFLPQTQTNTDNNGHDAPKYIGPHLRPSNAH